MRRYDRWVNHHMVRCHSHHSARPVVAALTRSKLCATGGTLRWWATTVQLPTLTPATGHPFGWTWTLDFVKNSLNFRTWIWWSKCCFSQPVWVERGPALFGHRVPSSNRRSWCPLSQRLCPGIGVRSKPRRQFVSCFALWTCLLHPHHNGLVWAGLDQTEVWACRIAHQLEIVVRVLIDDEFTLADLEKGCLWGVHQFAERIGRMAWQPDQHHCFAGSILLAEPVTTLDLGSHQLALSVVFVPDCE